MKKVSILVPVFNEEENIEPMSDALIKIMDGYEGRYDYEIVFRDNASTDKSLEILRKIASNNKKIKVIANVSNYGVDLLKDSFWGRFDGDIVISIPCDFQEPPELIPEFISWYEKGYEVVAGQKTSSKEGVIKYSLRQMYYKIISSISDVNQIPNMSGILLTSYRVLKLYHENNKYENIRYFLTDVGCDIKLIQYEQQKRRAGKSSYNFWRYLTFSIGSMIDVSDAPLRIATLMGVICSGISFLVGIVYLVMKLIWWDRFPAGMAPAMIGVFFLGSVQLLFIGILGEYVSTILRRVTPSNPPLVKELINYDKPAEDPYLFCDKKTEIESNGEEE